MDKTKRICLWSGPRNISTALMYAFAQRSDTKVFDEPLYAYYLRHHPNAKTFHPGAEAILATMENDGNKVVEMMMTTNGKPVLFFKHMTHHLLDLNRDFMKETINIILTRDPREMLPSFNKVIANPTMSDVGYKQHVELLDYFKNNDMAFSVLDSKKVLLEPEETLNRLCESIGVPFDKKMLSWEPQQLPEDGVWAKYWYHSVHNSSGFNKYKAREDHFPEQLNSLLTECMPYYETLIAHSI